MSGVVAGLIASVKSGSAPAPENLVLNPSFTTNIAGWEGAGNSARTLLFFRSAPASLENFFDGDNNPAAVYSRSSALTTGQAYSFSAWILNPVSSRTLRIGLTLGGTFYTQNVSVPASASWQYIKLENKTCGAGSLLIVEVVPFSVPYETTFYIDDVSVVLGATATP
jgi:hypothetical protein